MNTNTNTNTNTNKKNTKKRNIKLVIVEEDELKNKTLKAPLRSRCKKGTRKYKPLGPTCFTQEEINNYKRKRFIHAKEKPKVKPKLEFIITDEPEEIITLLGSKPEKTIEIKLPEEEKTKKRNLKTPIQFEIMEESNRYNEEFIDLMEKLSSIMLKQGEPFRARAYQKAQETIMAYQGDITSTSQLKGLPNIGSTIMDKLDEYVKTGTLKVLEREKNNPINILTDVYGIGPKKAQELVDAGIKSIDELRQRQDDLLNDVQRVGLKYYEDIQKRIPRSEIETYEQIFKAAFSKVMSKKANENAKFEIVGSYRRGAETSGDIDVIITGQTGDVYKAFVDELLETGVILEVLSRGQSKTLVISRLSLTNVARRVDFLYAPPDEFAFAILYFTGSKMFNTLMRQYALNKGYTFNEHGIYNLTNKKKGNKVTQPFNTEKDIFDFLGLQFKTPVERRDGRAVVPLTDVGEKVGEDTASLPTSVKDDDDQLTIIPVKKRKAVKKTETITEDEKDEKDEKDTLNAIEQFKHNGITALQSLNEKQLSAIIHYANNKYYNQTPVMTDNQYDIVKEFIEHKYPNNSAIREIGAEVGRNKVRLPYEMASMEKIKPDTDELEKWTGKYNGPYVLSCKLDGVSGLYDNTGSEPKLYTRGNGKFGQDISHLIPFLRLPKTKDIVIRGEFIIPKDVFETKYKNTFANPRNMVAGIINHKHINDAVTDLHFVAYEVIVPELNPSSQMEFIATLNVERVLYQVADTLSNEMLSTILVDWRKSYAYEIDGVIVIDDKIYPRTSGNPQHAFAFKMVLSDQIAEAKVVDVLWTPSKDGYLKPRVEIEPIKLGGVTITYATGFNAAFIRDNKIGIGSLIELIRSGDVIPYIRSVIVPAEETKMPDVPYKWNNTHVDIMLEDALNDPIVKEKNITGFFRGIEVEGLSSGNITRLIYAGYDSVPKIISMEEKDFLNVEGFKSKMAQKIYNGIHSKIKEASIITLMAASNLFGRGFSEKKMKLVMDELPDVLISDQSTNEKIASITVIKGMGLKSAEAFVDKIDEFVAFMKECGLEDKLYESPVQTANKSHTLYGVKVVLTGTRDKNVIAFLEQVGAIRGTDVSKNTALVITKHDDEDTSKAEEARKLDIPIMTIDQFVETYMKK